MADWLRDLIEDRRKIYMRSSRRSAEWRHIKTKVSRIVKKRKKSYNQFLIGKLEDDRSSRNFYQQVNGLLGTNDKPRWSPLDMYENKNEDEVADILAQYFNNISNEYTPLCATDLPVTYPRCLPKITELDVMNRIAKAKKKPSNLPGDLPPTVVAEHAFLLAKPLARIFNNIVDQGRWPIQWKTEFVTVIPKGPSPTEPGQCRNISCTNFFSKILGT